MSTDSCGGNCVTSLCPACPVEIVDIDAKHLHETLVDIADRIDGLMVYAEDEDYRAVAHKLQEAWGPLNSAATAAMNYAQGILERQ